MQTETNKVKQEETSREHRDERRDEQTDNTQLTHVHTDETETDWT